ncbi:MAG TPA: hypothetical protein VF331_22840 [Polyangiales bacterium]
MIFIAALAHMLLTLLGAAGERCGLDRTLKSNTSKKRQLSLYKQGLHWYMAIPNLPHQRLRPHDITVPRFHRPQMNEPLGLGLCLRPWRKQS